MACSGGRGSRKSDDGSRNVNEHLNDEADGSSALSRDVAIVSLFGGF